MRSIATCVLFLVVVCGAICEAASVDNHAAVRLERQAVDSNLFASTKLLIEELVGNLHKAAQKAADSMVIFAVGLKDQVRQCKEKIEAEIGKLKDRVTESIKGILDTFTNAGIAVKECIESHKRQADQLFNDAVFKTMSCADGKVQEVGDLISRQVEISKGGLEFANNALEQMKNCTESNNNILTKGACLGNVALRTEMKGAAFLTQSGISIARIDIALATLPVSLDMCAGKRLLEAGLGTAKIIMNLGKCKASSVFGIVTGLDVPSSNGASNVNDVTAEFNEPAVTDAFNVNDVPAEINIPVVTDAANFK